MLVSLPCSGSKIMTKCLLIQRVNFKHYPRPVWSESCFFVSFLMSLQLDGVSLFLTVNKQLYKCSVFVSIELLYCACEHLVTLCKGASVWCTEEQEETVLQTKCCLNLFFSEDVHLAVLHCFLDIAVDGFSCRRNSKPWNGMFCLWGNFFFKFKHFFLSFQDAS